MAIDRARVDSPSPRPGPLDEIHVQGDNFRKVKDLQLIPRVVLVADPVGGVPRRSRFRGATHDSSIDSLMNRRAHADTKNANIE